MRFTKMHGLGNDYLFINCFDETVADPAALSVAMSERHTGAGSDGIILVLPSEDHDFRMRILNADGSEAETCGNGIRCFSKYVHDHGLTDKTEFVIETLAGPNRVWLDVHDGSVRTVRSNMGQPEFERGKIPMEGAPGEVIEEELAANGSVYAVTCISMGNPHAIIFVDDAIAVPLADVGPGIETHPSFPNRTNVEFVEMIDRNNMCVRVWERGSGITLACGSGTCAAAVAAMRTGRAERTVTAHLELGDLEIEWAEDGSVFMTGPATEVYTGEWPEG
jgi:diaminopimelate epimerase